MPERQDFPWGWVLVFLDLRSLANATSRASRDNGGSYVKSAMRQSRLVRESMRKSKEQTHATESKDKQINHRAAWAFLVSREIAIEFHAILGISPKLFRPYYCGHDDVSANDTYHTPGDNYLERYEPAFTSSPWFLRSKS